MTVNLRSEGSVDLDEIIRLNRAASPPHDISTTLGTLTTTLLSSHRESRGTKLTSTASFCQAEGKGKAPVPDAWSLSASHGSEQDTSDALTLTGIGCWTEGPAQPPLKGLDKIPKRTYRTKDKKPPVIIHGNRPDDGPYPPSSEDEGVSVVEKVARRSSKETRYLRRSRKETKYLRHRATSTVRDHLVSAEEGHASPTAETARTRHRPLSRTRFYMLIAVLCMAALTLLSSIIAAHYTGKAHIVVTKSIIFSTVVLEAIYTVVGMTLARRSLQEALLAGLLEAVVGFSLSFELRKLMK